MHDSAKVQDLSDAEITHLQDRLEALPAGFEPLQLPAIDGYLCGVLLQPEPVPPARWWPAVLNAPRPGRAAAAADLIRPLVMRRHLALAAAIGQRHWFDPWLLHPGGAADPQAVRSAVLPWVAGFVLAQQTFPALEAIDDPQLVDALALLYQYLDPQDLEDDQGELAAAVAENEPAHTLAQAADDLVRAVLLLADVSRPRPRQPGT
jgi:uncharacterized protein